MRGWIFTDKQIGLGQNYTGKRCGALSKDSFKTKTTLEVADKSYEIFDITGFAEAKDFSKKIYFK